MTGAHGGFYDKGPFMYEETYRIPLLAYVPNLTAAGTECSRLVSNMDAGSTVLRLAGMTMPEEHDGRDLK
jgi:arylsulfatase A-like enzyme